MASGITAASIPITPPPIEGAAFTSVVAKFTDADKNTDPSRYSALINWGNGQTSKGVVTADPTGGFDVSGTYAFAEQGTYVVNVQISDKDGDGATARTTNLVGDAPLSAAGVTIAAAPDGSIHNGVVATFSDANPSARAGDFTASVAWGDGTASAATVASDPAGGFDVRSSHTYAVPGSYAISVSVREGKASVASTQFYSVANLSSDGAVPADHFDPGLVNPWGIAAGAGGPWWINNNGAGTSELDDGAANLSTGLPRVTVPPPTGSPAGTTSAPTGIVVQDTKAHPNDFVVKANGVSAPAIFLFATEDGTISGWNPKVNFTQAELGVDHSAAGAVYKGLALLSVPSGTLLPAGQYLFATNFRSGSIEVFDSQFNPVSLPAGAFHDPTIPAGFAPFGIQAVGGNLVVTYAKQDADKHDDVAGTGNGFVDVYNPAGFFIQRLGGAGFQPELNSPWGVTKAPASFGRFSNDLLVGNFGDSHISAFDPTTGAFVGQLSDAQGHPITFNGGFNGPDAKGLWGIAFGNGNGSGPANTLFFSAGINDEEDGLFGSVSPGTFSSATASSTGFVTTSSTATARPLTGADSTMPTPPQAGPSTTSGMMMPQVPSGTATPQVAPARTTADPSMSGGTTAVTRDVTDHHHLNHSTAIRHVTGMPAHMGGMMQPPMLHSHHSRQRPGHGMGM